jgi:hypothetical protein
MSPQSDRLRRFLAEPDRLAGLPLADWDLLIPQARRSGLLARLCALLQHASLLHSVPDQPRQHLTAERIIAEKHRQDVAREIRHIRDVLAPIDTPIILLKGAAYVAAGLPVAEGRSFGDIDILVAREKIGSVETALRTHGWRPEDLSPYDERYYRKWMHQIPPMTHYRRKTVIDVHHTIVARTTRVRLDASKLFASALPVGGDRLLRVLAPEDMILHSATHLLNEGEFGRGLRDLDDINRLLRHFGQDAAFWPRLLERAEELDLRRPLYYALRYTAMLLEAPVPEPVRKDRRLDPPAAALRALMDALFERALRPDHPSCRDLFSGTALGVLYIRAHYLLMPLPILVPHLLRKAILRSFKDDRTHNPGR